MEDTLCSWQFQFARPCYLWITSMVFTCLYLIEMIFSNDFNKKYSSQKQDYNIWQCEIKCPNFASKINNISDILIYTILCGHLIIDLLLHCFIQNLNIFFDSDFIIFIFVHILLQFMYLFFMKIVNWFLIFVYICKFCFFGIILYSTKTHK